MEDRFGLWYRFKSLVVFNLLYIAGPAQLDRHLDPRKAVEQEYERRRDLHRERLGKPPVVKKDPGKDDGVDPVVLCAVGGVLALVVLFVWALASR
ncbi:hypothetical protein [Microlunatus antarcticus]|uniref:Uncharacterized protein n=1 Tax=Microlunatus antarcticus TaxID=53388 RepID=A0A7W5JS79_9ACTN|nr:hypothetical protein [Microlunatus antarcticus]MBB3325285.1 hypothetical protein [Microlunatus antarcticus]